MLKLALRNVVRQRGRTLITLAAIVFGVAGLIVSGGFISDLLDQLGEAVIHSQTGHLQIARRGFRDEGARRPERYSIAEPDRLAARLRLLPVVDDAMGRLDFSAVLNNGRTDLAIVGEGIEPDREARLGHSMRLTAGRRLAAADAHGAMIGQGLAHALRLAPGDRATLVTSTGAGAVNTADVEVVGVFQTFSKDYDARAVKVPLVVAQQLLDTQGASTLVVALKRTEDTQRAAEALKAMLKDDYEIATWQELNDFYSKTVTLYERQFGVLQLIILLTVMLSVANSVNMSVSERVAEFGTMRALGNRARTVVGLVVTETLLLGAVGAALGLGVGLLLAAAISAVGIPMPPPPNADLGYLARIRPTAGVLGAAFAIGLVATVAAGTIAGMRAARTPVAIALRSGV